MCNKKRFYAKKPSGNWEVGPDYEVVRQIGSGSYGTVCEAFKVSTREQVAIKRISGIFDTPFITKRYLREISILTCLNHPNVLKIRDILKPPNLESFNELYIVMEYAPSDLSKLLKSPFSLQGDHIQLILYNILCGLNYIHSANLLHRDLKPENILMYHDCEVKICDFGLSRAIPDSEADSHSQNSSIARKLGQASPIRRRTMTAHVVTRWYRAPELILLEKSYGKPIDIWSMGCIIGELCGMIEENTPYYTYRGPLLRGNSCYPLSPKNVKEPEHQSAVRESDQLNLILELIGTPSDSEINFIRDKQTATYLKSFRRHESISLSDIYPYSCSDVIGLMECMLQFDPRKRINVERALSLQYFDSIRDFSKEKEADFNIYLEFEDKEVETGEELRTYFLKEIAKFNI